MMWHNRTSYVWRSSAESSRSTLIHSCYRHIFIMKKRELTNCNEVFLKRCVKVERLNWHKAIYKCSGYAWFWDEFYLPLLRDSMLFNNLRFSKPGKTSQTASSDELYINVFLGGLSNKTSKRDWLSANRMITCMAWGHFLMCMKF